MFSSGAMKSKVDLLDASRMLFAKGYKIYATAGTAAFLNAHGVTTEAVYWPDERPDAENNVMTMIADHAFDLIVNIPKNHTKRELTNGYKIRRGAIDHNIPLITNARLASAFIEAFCEMKLEDIQKKKIIFLFSQVQCFDAFRQRIFCIRIQELFYFLNGRKLTLDALKEKIIRI